MNRGDTERVFDLLLDELDEYGANTHRDAIRRAITRLRDVRSSSVAQEAAWWAIASELTDMLGIAARVRSVATDHARLLLLVHEQVSVTRERGRS